MKLNRFQLYELCVQNPKALVPLLLGIHGGDPRVLREDFCGTGALSREWVGFVKGGRAVAVDIDSAPLRRAKGRGVTPILGDAITTGNPKSAGAAKADVIFVGNFSIGEIHERRTLVRYLKACRGRLVTPDRRGRRGGGEGGVFVCDTYGGASAFTQGSVQRTHPGPVKRPDLRIRYTWEQRSADPLTARVVNALHFRVEQMSGAKAGEIIQEATDAFVYRWRLWSIAELRDAMLEAGFRSTGVYAQLPDAQDSEGRYYARPLDDPDDLGENYIVCVAGRA